ncbi:unnamed protein product [Rangifer tarandus platyrhynchus]|uniref:Uncharacterized protein n=1 Tax=Rangifer tarandus platyrhynchus TaxID=3082113 RepID=A0ABN8YNR0_RANTA|nr:unnamed protein product [Rangifer tarandus platyrhynchus]
MVNPWATGRHLPVWCKNHVIHRLCASYKATGLFHCYRHGTQTIPTLEQRLHMASQWLFRDESSSFLFLYHKASKHPFGFPVAQLVKNLPAMWETWVGKIPWRREWLLTPVFWPVEFHGLYSPWGLKESDTTERLSLSET